MKKAKRYGALMGVMAMAMAFALPAVAGNGALPATAGNGAVPVKAVEPPQTSTAQQAQMMQDRQGGVIRGELQQRYQEMTPAERKQLRQNAKQRYEALPPERQQRAKERFQSKHPGVGLPRVPPATR